LGHVGEPIHPLRQNEAARAGCLVSGRCESYSWLLGAIGSVGADCSPSVILTGRFTEIWPPLANTNVTGTDSAGNSSFLT